MIVNKIRFVTVGKYIDHVFQKKTSRHSLYIGTSIMFLDKLNKGVRYDDLQNKL